MQTLSIIIGGDLVPTQSNSDLFASVRLIDLFGHDLLTILAQSDFRVFNLESPLIDKGEPINKNGPNLIAPTCSIKVIKGINSDLITLANNHILDQGEQGLYTTLQTLTAAGINYIGAGENLQTAAQSFVLTDKRLSIGFYACAEHEFTIASAKTAGANPFDPLESLDHIYDLKSKCDYLIVLYHGGREHYRYPSPNLQKTCRKMVDKGADLVVCQHSHCIGAHEQYHNGTIVYGQGNFLFDGSDNEVWQTSLLVQVTVTEQDRVIDFIPIVKQGNGIRLAGKEQAAEILMNFHHRSQMILSEDFVQEEYEKIAARMLENYLTSFYGDSFTFKLINKLTGHKLTQILHTQKSLNRLRNFLDCESHREIILMGLRERTRS